MCLWRTLNNRTIRKITPDGVVTTVGGDPIQQATADGIAGAAQFNYPSGIAIDALGRLWITDEKENVIRLGTPHSSMEPVISQQPQSQAVNDGSSVTVQVKAVGSLPLLYQWRFNGTDIASATNAYLSLASVTTDQTGVYSVVVSNSVRAGVSPNAVLTVIPVPPTITTQPQSQTVNDGSSASFQVGVVGSLPLLYQWRFNGADLVSATNAGLAFAAVRTDQAGVYSVVVSNSLGAVVSSNAVLTVRSVPPTITTQPQSQTVNDGSSVTLQVTAVGSLPLLYQWRFNGADLVSATNAGLAFTAVSTDEAGVYSVVVSNSLGAVVSSNVVLTVIPVYQFTTIAGQPSGDGNADGTGSAARFYGPVSVAVDSARIVYVADSGNDTIRKIALDGVVTTLAGLAGWETQGSADGAGSAARFNGPSGVAVDSAGNVFVADTENHTIRKVTPDGVVTTLAGLAGSLGRTDGKGSAARFYQPSGVAVDNTGNVFVADTYNQTIRKVTPDGVVTTLAGLGGWDNRGSADGTGSAARFNGPFGVAVDSADNAYVADSLNNTIRKITPGGVVTTLAGLAGNQGSADGTGSEARFYNPSGVAVDSVGNVFVADIYNRTIRKVTPGGVVTTLAGQVGRQGGQDGTGSGARFFGPAGIAVDAQGQLWVVDNDENVIRLGTPLSKANSAPSIIQQPQSQDVDAGESVTFYMAATGYPTPQYQWRFNGSNLLSATNAGLFLAAVTTNQAGAYSVVVSNTAGVVVSSNALLTVTNVPPTITGQPQNEMMLCEGSSASFQVTAVGILPLRYQWRLNGADLASATNADLSFAHITTNLAGIYSVVVSNPGGAVVSSNAALTVGCLAQIIAETPPGETISLAATGTIPGGVTINKSLTIMGPGATHLTISGGSPVFLVSTGVNFTLSVVTVADGRAQAGAGLYNDHGRVLVVDCVFSNNIATGPAGATGYDCVGGCYWTPNGLECGGCESETGGDGVIGGNGWGGAFYNDGFLTLSNCYLTANQAVGGPGGNGGNGSMIGGSGGPGGSGAGGGACNLGSLAVFNTSFVDNSAQGGIGGPSGGVMMPEHNAAAGGSAAGGAIWNLGSLSGRNVTLFRNRTTGGVGSLINAFGRDLWAANGFGNGGALGNTNAVGLTNCTFSGNSADFGGAIGSWSGPVVCVNSILANSPLGGNTWGTITDSGHNLSSDGTCGFAGSGSRNNTDPALAKLDYYGGATPTLALLECSPALDAGDGLASPATDQRGSPRPAGAGVDIGAFEGSVPGCLRITAPLVDQAVLIGSPVTLTVSAEGTPPLSYQWQFNGTNLLDATDSSLSLEFVLTNHSGYYAVVVSNPAGLSISAARLTVGNGESPKITTQPRDQNVYSGELVTLSVSISGYPTPAYQWRCNGKNLESVTNASLSLASITTNQAGIYSVVVSNSLGVVVSSNAVVTVSTAPPMITAQPQSQTADGGSTVSFQVTALGSLPLSYQWRKDGINLAGANGATYSIVRAQTSDAGSYTVVVANLLGTVTSTVARLTVIPDTITWNQDRVLGPSGPQPYAGIY
jgi:sugar lactone lactonase YvrE